MKFRPVFQQLTIKHRALLGTAAVLAAGLFAVASVEAIAAAPNAAGGRQRTEIIQTDSGPVRGFVAGGMRQFLGVPFAAPPVGDLRWRAPAAASSLEHAARYREVRQYLRREKCARRFLIAK